MIHMYSETCLEQPLKNTTNKGLNAICSLMQAKSTADCFGLNQAIIGFENYFWSSFEWPLLKHWFYCNIKCYFYFFDSLEMLKKMWHFMDFF